MCLSIINIDLFGRPYRCGSLPSANVSFWYRFAVHGCDPTDPAGNLSVGPISELGSRRSTFEIFFFPQILLDETKDGAI